MIRNVLSHILLYYQPGKFKDIKQFLFSAENFREDLFYSENENQTTSQLSGPGKSSSSTFFQSLLQRPRRRQKIKYAGRDVGK